MRPLDSQPPCTFKVVFWSPPSPSQPVHFLQLLRLSSRASATSYSPPSNSAPAPKIKKMFTNKKNRIKPLKGDLVIIHHRIKIKYKNRRLFKEGVFYLKCLGPIYCPAIPTHFLATVINSATQLDPLLTSLWQKLSRSLSSPTSGFLCSSSSTTSLDLSSHSCQQT